MTDKNPGMASIGEAQRRWMHVGPYYAMFPLPRVCEVIAARTRPGDAVLDPFAGRFSVPALAGYMGREGCGVEISPLGWLYGRVKMNPAQREGDVLRRLREMADAGAEYKSEARNADEFFRACYCPEVLRFLLACRSELNWKKSPVDATLMALVMVSMHHGIGSGLSNQMRQPKAMAPRYSVNWWRSRGMESPPKVDPVKFLQKRAAWRYARGVFRDENSRAFLGDSCDVLQGGAREWAAERGGVKLLFTSPPYWSLVNYFKDQWIRLWMLGGPPSPAVQEHAFKKDFSAKEKYRVLMRKVFGQCAKLMREDGVVVVRMDARRFTRETIVETLRECFPGHRRDGRLIVTKGRGQTELFNDLPGNDGERDIILVPA